MWDVVLYNGEADMLECRIDEIGARVEAMIVIEGTLTFQGKPHLVRDMSPLRSVACCRVIHAVVAPPIEGDHWDRENWTRRQVGTLLNAFGCPPDAMVLHGDVDEIPALWVCDLKTSVPISLTMRHHPFAVDWEGEPTTCGVLAPRSLYDEADVLRNHRRYGMPSLTMAGHHFSWVGTEAERRTKLDSFSHPEAEEWLGPVLSTVRTTGEGWLSPLDPTTVDDTYPRWIREGHAPPWWWRDGKGSEGASGSS